VSDNGLAADGGWGITDFRYVHYRVESETPGATVTAQYYQGDTSDHGAAKGAWADGVRAANDNIALATPPNTDMNWNAAATNTAGTWVLPNIIRRSRNGTNQIYTVLTKNGTPESRTSTGTLRMFKSYNRDLTQAQLGLLPSGAAPTLTPTGSADLNNGQGVLTFGAYEASKSYVVGSAALNGQTAKGGEGVFRTVIMLGFSTARNANNIIAVEGSNVKNGMPSIAGFPVRDAEETGDNRFIKLFYNNNGNNRNQYYWVSTEIVCEWYFLSWGGGAGQNGTHMSVGDANNYIMVGYGDLSFGYDIAW